MSRLIAHRGPDGAGVWQSARGQAGLAHRRLAIIDLSEEAGQPMEGANGTAIAFNGEIYNHIELREQLASGWSFRSHSDTECILRSEEHTSELQSLMRISYAVFCLKKKKLTTILT